VKAADAATDERKALRLIDPMDLLP
jgi:hypothetical protein